MRHVRETEAYWALFSWTTTLLVRLSFRIGLKATNGNKPQALEQVMLYLLSRCTLSKQLTTD
jgi:hypothetical protein